MLLIQWAQMQPFLFSEGFHWVLELSASPAWLGCSQHGPTVVQGTVAAWVSQHGSYCTTGMVAARHTPPLPPCMWPGAPCWWGDSCVKRRHLQVLWISPKFRKMSSPSLADVSVLPGAGACCRSAQQEAEAAAAERSQQLRRVAAQEALLKDAFLQAVEAEKERLLLARERQGKPSSAPQARLSCFYV